MLTQLTGNGRLLLTVNGDGQWGSLFYPYAGQFQHLRETRLGVFEVANQQFTWLTGGNGFDLVQSEGALGNAPRAVWKGRGIEVRATDGTGVVQPEDFGLPAPDGSWGQDSITVQPA